MKTKLLCITLALSTIFSSCSKKKMDEPGNLVPKTVDQDNSLPSITINGAMLHAEAYGHPDSTLIICLHGGPGADYRYLLNCKALANHGYRVVFYDQRGSGLSQRFPKSSYTELGLGALDIIYNELSGVIAHYRTHPKQKVFLLGHSWGAMLATAYSGRYPGAVQGLVVCEPGGLVWDDVVDYVTRSQAFNLWGEALHDGIYPEQFLSGKPDQHEVLDYKLSMLASKNEITGDDNTIPNSFWRPGAVISNGLYDIGVKYKPDFSAGIKNFKLPVLFLHSGKNKAYPLSWAQRIAEAYPSVELFEVAVAGHSDMIFNSIVWNTQTLPKLIHYFHSR